MTLRVGIVGGGIRGSVFAQTVVEHPESELAGFVELNAGVAERLRASFGVAVHERIDDMLGREVDAVIIATPDFAHLEPGLKALRAGKHVLFEKPLATSADDARQLKEAADASDARVVVGFENRWNPKFNAVRQILTDEDKPLIAQRVLLSDTEFVPRRMLSWAGTSSPAWFLFPHSLDMAMWLSGARPVEVHARGVKKVLAPDGIDTYDRVSASFLMSDDSILTLESGWVLPESRPAVFQFRYDIETYGNQFEITIDDSGITRFHDAGASFVGAPATDRRGRLVGAHIDMVRDFVDCSLGEDLDVPGIDAGYEVSMAIVAAHESLSTNNNVTIKY